jgi:hypothetical protein
MLGTVLQVAAKDGKVCVLLQMTNESQALLAAAFTMAGLQLRAMHGTIPVSEP